ncbi:MAG: hypothetical protein B6245_05955 [Desulfobacteraceae bacterium 4572_88]|nr:MAG: hypothetical protein B6245_05955 [Desulfobacteraceae bacterium 4572_88]
MENELFKVVTEPGLITINETLFVQLISFLLFMVIMNRVMFRPLRKIINERESYIETLRSEISDAEEQLNVITHQLKNEESAIRERAFAFKEELSEVGNQQANEVFGKAGEEIDALKEKTRKEIELQISEARKYIRTESQILSVSIMEKILDRRLSA